MVQLVEVEDEHFQLGQLGPADDDADYTDTGTCARNVRPAASAVVLSLAPWQARRPADPVLVSVDSEISTESDFDASAETLADRLYALRDIVPPTVRGWIHGRFQSTNRILRTGLAFVGRAVWTVSVSALLVGIPFALCWAEEQNMIAMEQEQRMREMGGELLTGGAGPSDKGDGDTASQVGAALGPTSAKPAL